ncbi:CBS domain-containing protein [Hathewaya histolytica]|uniref:CBS domain-containing protein n=1 Tax=Hathewaya histolytica TaxID=1498 RepID=UPI003B66EE27
MNIAFFLTPKIEVVYVTENSTLGKTLKIMEKNKYSAIPIIDDKGKYVGTLTEGDILWYIQEKLNKNNLNLENIYITPLKQIPRKVKNSPVKINSNIENLIILSISQNFVPVVDDENTFIGIIKRSIIINFCYEELKTTKECI